PVVDACREALEELTRGFDPDSAGWSSADWTAKTEGQWLAGRFKEFDQDEDGRVTREEMERGLEVAYGIRDGDGNLLRRETGQVFNWRTYVVEVDKNGDRKFHRDEILRKFEGSAAQKEALFQKRNADSDGLVTIADLLPQNMYVGDILGKY